MVSPRAVEGSWASASPTTPAKCTSPPNPNVTVWPLPFQPGLSGEWAGKCWATVWFDAEVVDVVVEGVPDPPEKKPK
jgi:hypothetical protein